MKLFCGIVLSMIFTVMPYMGQAQVNSDKMMESQGMPGSGANECFKHSMEQALDLQQLNIRNPSRQSAESDKEMMDQLEQARLCLQEAGAPGSGGKSAREKQMQCADDWLDRSIARHRNHMDNPSTKTEASQKQLLRDMRRSYNCTGPARAIIDGTGELDR